MIAANGFPAEFIGRIDGRVNLSSQSSLRLSEQRGEFSQSHIPNHHQIYVTASMFFTAGQ
jgi:hypothetical protein